MRWKALSLAAALAVLVAGQAQAAYTYSTSITIGAPSGASGTVVNTPGAGATFTTTSGTVVNFTNIANPGTFIVPGSATYNFGNLAVTTTSATPETFIVPYSVVITITNPTPGGSTGTFTANGTLNLTAVQFAGGASGGSVTNTYSAPFTQNITVPPTGPNATVFTLNLGTGAVNDFFGPPTINNPGAGGNIGGRITSAPVPEPSSALLLGLLGVPSVAAYHYRRRRVANAG